MDFLFGKVDELYEAILMNMGEEKDPEINLNNANYIIKDMLERLGFKRTAKAWEDKYEGGITWQQ